MRCILTGVGCLHQVDEGLPWETMREAGGRHSPRAPHFFHAGVGFRSYHSTISSSGVQMIGHPCPAVPSAASNLTRSVAHEELREGDCIGSHGEHGQARDRLETRLHGVRVAALHVLFEQRGDDKIVGGSVLVPALTRDLLAVVST